MLILFQVVPPEVTSHDSHLVIRLAMEANNTNSTGSLHTPIPAASGGGVVPPPPPLPTRTNANHTPTTFGNGTFPTMTTTIVPTIHNASGAPFTYGMSGSNTSSNLTYSTLQIVGLGEGSSNAPLQGSFMGTTTPFNAIPYGGGHIPPPSPSLGGSFQQPSRIKTNSILFSGGIHGPQSYMILVGYMHFSLFGVFRNNAFLSFTFSAGGKPLIY
jgi:hypothetical protein